MKFTMMLFFLRVTAALAQSDIHNYKASFDKYMPQAKVEIQLSKKLQPFDFEILAKSAEDLSETDCQAIKTNMQSKNGFYDNVTGEKIISDFCTEVPMHSGNPVYRKLTLHHVTGQTNMGLNYKMILQSSIPSYAPGKRSAFLVFLDENKQVLEIQDQDFAIDATKKIDLHMMRVVSKDAGGHVYERSFYYTGSWGLNSFVKLEKYDFYGFASADQKNPIYFKLRTYTPQDKSLNPTFEELAIYESPDATWDHVLPAMDGLHVGHVFQYGEVNQRMANLTRRIFILTQIGVKSCSYGSVSGNSVSYEKFPANVQDYADCANFGNYGHRQQN